MPDEAPAHLVLGGSHGIGYAYAEYWATRGESIILVARDSNDLRRAELRLLKTGASSVRAISGDLLNEQFRDSLFGTLAEVTFVTVLVSGPSPPAGELPSVGIDAFYRAHEACIIYPLSALRWLMSRPQPIPDRIFLISSDAIANRCSTRFFLSSLYRRALDDVIECMKRESNALGAALEVWYPVVVRTRLAEQYAQRIADADVEGGLDEILSKYLGVERVSSAEAYIRQQLS